MWSLFAGCRFSFWLRREFTTGGRGLQSTVEGRKGKDRLAVGFSAADGWKFGSVEVLRPPADGSG